MEYRKILTSRWLSLICLNFRYEETDSMDKRAVYAFLHLNPGLGIGCWLGHLCGGSSSYEGCPADVCRGSCASQGRQVLGFDGASEGNDEGEQ